LLTILHLRQRPDESWLSCIYNDGAANLNTSRDTGDSFELDVAI
jgi:hypothetical protein